MKVLASIIACLLFCLIGSICKNNEIIFSVISKDNIVKQVSKSTDEETLNSYFSSQDPLLFKKLILEQSNNDHLVIEQKDEEGYLILLKLRHEQFVIEKQPHTREELQSIMLSYLSIKDGIMKNNKFY